MGMNRSTQMKKVTTEEAQKFLIRPELWKFAEKNELNAWVNNNDFYWAQLEKLQAFGIKINGGGASHIAKGCTPSRAVYIVFWVFSSMEALIRSGFDYYSAVQLIEWIALVTIGNKVHDNRLKQRTENVFSGLGFPELGESDMIMFFQKVLPGIRSICGTIRYSGEHMKMLNKAAGRPEQLSLPLTFEQKSLREKVLARYDSRCRREPGFWQRQWLDNACKVLAEKFGMQREVAIDLIKMILIAAREANSTQNHTSHQQWKYRTQDLLADLGLSLDEPGTSKFFNDLLVSILSEIDRVEDASFAARLVTTGR